MTCIPQIADSYPLEKLPEGWKNAEVTFRHSQGNSEKRYEILDIRGKDPHFVRYLHEPLKMTACKCAQLFFCGLPLYFLFYSLFHCLRLPLVTIAHLSPTAFAKQLWAIVRIPFYFIALELAALYGIFQPLEGRALLGDLESRLHEGKGRRDAIQYKYEEQSLVDLSFQVLTEREHRQAFFAGFCMQEIGKTNDPHIIQVEILPLPAPPAA